jgi:hypothetical protein
MSYIGQEPGQGQAERFLFTASGGETSISAGDDGRMISYTVHQVSVYLNGVKLVEGSGKDFQATNGSTITGLAALTAGDVVDVFCLSAFSASDTVSASTGGTFSGNVSFSGTTTTTGDATHNGNIVMATNKKVQQKGSFMQSSFHQSLVLGA